LFIFSATVLPRIYTNSQNQIRLHKIGRKIEIFLSLHPILSNRIRFWLFV